MMNLQFPPPEFEIERRGERAYVFDPVRKAWLLLTGEEWVRQNMVAFFVKTLRYPKEMVALEKEIFVNGLKKRFDILVYDSAHRPWMLVECKEENIRLSEAVLQQLLRYHIAVPVRWMIITNGVQTMGWQKESTNLVVIDTFPKWNE